MSRFVRYEKFGGPDVLEVIDVEPPHPGPGQVRVRVLAAGLNPVDFKIFRGGPAAETYGATLPSGVGNDFAGIIDEIGDGATGWTSGDAVLGGSRHFAMADFVIVDATGVLIRKPAGLDFDAAGALSIAGRTAWASVAAIEPTQEDTVLVSAAAGGVGVLAAQLALRAGATVIGTAGRSNQEFLRSLGVTPVVYGDGLADRIRRVAPNGVTAALDNHGSGTVSLALELGVRPERINTIAAHAVSGVQTVGGAAAGLSELDQLARLLSDGDIVLPIDSVFPIERVGEAYERLETGHVRGKIVAVTE
jgi:NADPH:quinone reductase-like Zn-dependent oxidoreductase